MERTEISALLDLVLEKIAKVKTIDTETYALLVTMFPSIIAPALDIIDNGRVTRLQCQKTKRRFHKVKESHSAAGRKTETIHEQDGGSFDVIRESFCHCYFFAKECLSPTEAGIASICKHILAVKIAEALTQETVATVVVKEIEDRDFAPLMLQSRAYLSKYEETKSAR